MSRWAMIFGGITWVATVALAFVLGRTSATSLQSTQTPIASPSPSLTRPVAKIAAVPLPMTSPTPAYPQYSSTIPKAFRGSWDEIVSDGCKDREARFTITADKIYNFEVEQDVSRVKLYSPTDIDVDITSYDDNKNQVNDTMMLKVVDGGQTLTGRKKGSSFFRKCPTAD